MAPGSLSVQIAAKRDSKDLTVEISTDMQLVSKVDLGATPTTADNIYISTECHVRNSIAEMMKKIEKMEAKISHLKSKLLEHRASQATTTL